MGGWGAERRKPPGEMFNNHKLAAVNTARGVPSSCLRLTGRLVSLSVHWLVNPAAHSELSSSRAHTAERTHVGPHLCCDSFPFVFFCVFKLLKFLMRKGPAL